MRLSKTQKQTIKDHQNQKPSKDQLEDLRSERKKLFKLKYNFINPMIGQPKPNRKKNKDLRKIRFSNKMAGYVFKYNPTSKYTPDPFTTKRAR